MSDTTMIKQILLTRQSSAYSRVTFNHPPLNIFGPETIPQLNEGSGTEKILDRSKVRRRAAAARPRMYPSKEGARRPSGGLRQNPPNAQLPKTPRRTELLSSMCTQAEHRIRAAQHKFGNSKIPRFPQITGFGTCLSKINHQINQE
jgi:hypothetical protein